MACVDPPGLLDPSSSTPSDRIRAWPKTCLSSQPGKRSPGDLGDALTRSTPQALEVNSTKWSRTVKPSLKFGTSGLRGLATDLIGPEARRYVRAFLRALQDRGELVPGLYLGGDFRESSAQIIEDCVAAAAELGIKAICCGTLPTPALAMHAMAASAPSIMVTGSHIPQDRNGLKFYTRLGEISKADEAAIVKGLEAATPGNYRAFAEDEAAAARQRYVVRYSDFLPRGALQGMRIGVFEHSSVARDLLVEILASFGAEITRLGRIDGFIAVDTEALSDPVLQQLEGWVRQHKLDAIFSTDGDADRPLMIDGTGRGDTGHIQYRDRSRWLLRGRSSNSRGLAIRHRSHDERHPCRRPPRHRL